MILVHCEQGSEEWHRARAGVITASMFSVVRERLKSGPNKGDFSSKAKDYAFRLAIERISGVPLDDGFETYQMRRGHELEPMARMEHEAATGFLVERAGFMLTDDRLFGCSVDGLIQEDGGSEYKCFTAPDKLRAIYIDGDVSELMDQVQGGMWLSGRKWWHIGLYCPALASLGKQLWYREFKRDDDYIEAMEQDLILFERLVSDNEAALRHKEAA